MGGKQQEEIGTTASVGVGYEKDITDGKRYKEQTHSRAGFQEA